MDYLALPEQLSSKIEPCPTTGCWLWIGYVNKQGYGWVNYGSGKDRFYRAHRIIYELLVRPIPKGLHCDHLCRNRCCVNPLHIEPVTPLENTRRGEDYRVVQTHCKYGHPLTDKNILRRGRKGRRCIACSKDQARRWYLNNSEKVIERVRLRRIAHRKITAG